MKIRYLIAIMCSFLASFTFAKEPVTLGNTYPITEDDLLLYLQNRAKTIVANGEWQQFQENALSRIKQQTLRPSPLSYITRTEQDRTWRYDLSIRVPFDMSDHHGKVFAKKGEIINPLMIVTLKKILLFINGDDVRQVQYAKSLMGSSDKKIKIILTAGSIEEVSRELHVPIYFDQHGLLTNRFGILHVPATVQQEAFQLLIKEKKI